MASNAAKLVHEDLSIKTGIDRKDRTALARALSVHLANTYVLYGQTQAYHWNVTGPLFFSIHSLTEKQYADMAEAIDAIAERIRAIGFTAPSGLHTMVSLAEIDDKAENPDAKTMLEQLASNNEKVAASARHAVELAEEAGDVYTADLLTARIGIHEESAWMLRASMAD